MRNIQVKTDNLRSNMWLGLRTNVYRSNFRNWFLLEAAKVQSIAT